MWSVEYSRCSRLARWMVALAVLVVSPEAARAVAGRCGGAKPAEGNDLGMKGKIIVLP